MLEISPNIQKVLDLTNLVLLDIKHINPKKSMDLVGFSNEKELAFAKYLDEHDIPVWIRQVLVPGITDGEEDLVSLKNFLSTLHNIKKIEILPYQSLGKYKWETLGLEYKLKDVRDATVDDVARAKEILGLN